MNRITVKDLEALIARLNRATGSPAEPYTRDDIGIRCANIGCYHLSRAYGGFALHRMVNEHGGVSEPFYTGHIPARDLYNRIHAYLMGYEARQHEHA